MPDVGSYIFAGLSGLGRGIEQRAARLEQQQKEEKERAQRFTKLVSAFDELGWMNKDVATTKSLDELEGIAEGKQLLGKIGETDLRNKLTKLEIADKERAAQNEAALTSALGSATTTATPAMPGLIPEPQTANVPLTRNRLLQAFQQNPAAAATPTGRALLVQAMGEQANGQTPYTPEPFDVGGMKGIVSPRTGSIHVQGQPTGGLSFEERIALMDRNALLRRKEAITKAMGGFVTPDVKDYYAAELKAINDKLAAGGKPTVAPADTRDPLGLFP